MDQIPKNLLELIRKIIGESPSPLEMREFVFLCKKIGVLHLRKKLFQGKLVYQYYAGSMEDLAHDCLADLFQRDEQGSLIQLREYFDGFSWSQCSDEQLMALLRRLICSKVNLGIFRIYNEADPGMAKVLRNVKISIGALQNCSVKERFGEQFIYPLDCELLEHLPECDTELIAQRLSSEASANDDVPTILRIVADYLRQLTGYRRLVSLLTVARIIRDYYVRFADRGVDAGVPDDQFINAEVREAIILECQRMKKEMYQRYVANGKVTTSNYELYFAITEQIISDRLIGNDGDVTSYYLRLQAVMPGLSREEYIAIHRSKLEYYVRQAEGRVIKQLKRQYS